MSRLLVVIDLGQLVEREKAGGERGANIYTIVNVLPSQVYCIPLKRGVIDHCCHGWTGHLKYPSYPSASVTQHIPLPPTKVILTISSTFFFRSIHCRGYLSVHRPQGVFCLFQVTYCDTWDDPMLPWPHGAACAWHIVGFHGCKPPCEHYSSVYSPTHCFIACNESGEGGYPHQAIECIDRGRAQDLGDTCMSTVKSLYKVFFEDKQKTWLASHVWQDNRASWMSRIICWSTPSGLANSENEWRHSRGSELVNWSSKIWI